MTGSAVDQGNLPVAGADDDTPREACGVFGVYAPGQPVAHLIQFLNQILVNYQHLRDQYLHHQ